MSASWQAIVLARVNPAGGRAFCFSFFLCSLKKNYTFCGRLLTWENPCNCTDRAPLSLSALEGGCKTRAISSNFQMRFIIISLLMKNNTNINLKIIYLQNVFFFFFFCYKWTSTWSLPWARWVLRGAYFLWKGVGFRYLQRLVCTHDHSGLFGGPRFIRKIKFWLWSHGTRHDA
jgi:hypothetical protein